MRCEILKCGFRLWILGMRIDLLRGCLNAAGGLCLRLKRPLSSKPIVAMNRRLCKLFALFEAGEKQFAEIKERIENESSYHLS